MFSTHMTFIGVDPTAGQKPFAYAALDQDLHLLAIGEGTFEEVLAFASGQRQAIVAVSSPQRPNLGLLEREEIRQALTPPPWPGRWSDFRVAEYILRQHQITAPQTRRAEQDCPNWMQMGFRFYRRMEKFGYRLFPAEEAPLQYMEVYPHACYTVLLGTSPFPKISLEGRIQRQLALYECKLRIPDAMDFFEEITRHRLLKGQLPVDALYGPAELDALVAAYTAWLAHNQPEQTSCVGEPSEGQIFLPTANLKDHYAG